MSLSSSPASCWLSSREYVAMRFIQPRSAPAEKLLPSERRTRRRTCGCLEKFSIAVFSALMRTSSKALWTSGRLSVSVATPRSSRVVSRAVMVVPLHAEHAELRVRNVGIEGGGNGQAKHVAGFGRVYHAVIPETGTGIGRLCFLGVLVYQGLPERYFFFRTPLHAFFGQRGFFHIGEHAGGLLTAHDGNTGIGPHEQKAWLIGAATHAVITSTKTSTNDDGEFRNLGAGHCMNHLGTMFGDATFFVFFPHHEASDVLQEDQRNFALAAQFYEMRAFYGGLRKQDAVIGNDTDRIAPKAGKAGDQGAAVNPLVHVKV